jgi:hypothetical protein
VRHRRPPGRRLTEYEERGGQDLGVDVLDRSPYREVFSAEASSGSLDRPAARATIVLRSGAEREVVVGTAGITTWCVDRLRTLTGTVALAPGQRVGLGQRPRPEEVDPAAQPRMVSRSGEPARAAVLGRLAMGALRRPPEAAGAVSPGTARSSSALMHRP